MAGMTHDMGGMKGMPGMGVNAGAPPANPSAKTLYTCVMHPEIIRDKPGKCPKCGMKLVPRKQG